MTGRAVRMWPQYYARICGVLYLYIIVMGIFAELFVRSRLVVPADATATAANIVANESLFRIGFSAELSLALWLVVRGVDAAKWEEWASAGEPI